MRRSWLFVLPACCLMMSACPDDMPRRPDPTKGTITGSVVCTDTGKPARFAEVQLLPAAIFNASGSVKNSEQDLESETTGLDGRFKIEAVPPGEYYAYATLNGYLDPERGIDFNRVSADADDEAQMADALSQWKDHFIAVSVSVQHTTEITIPIERGAEIDGAVNYDDSSPAIGVRFELLRKTGEEKWSRVGDSHHGDWTIDETSDSHGRYRLTNLPAGEYKVCVLLPVHSEEQAPHVCLGNTFRKKNAQSVNVNAGEISSGADIVIPLTGLFTVSGFVTVGADGHAPEHATVHLLDGDDRVEERNMAIRRDGSFEFRYVPADSYILAVTGAMDSGNNAEGDSAKNQQMAVMHFYQDKELPLSVQSEMSDVNLTLTEAPKKPAGP